MKPIEITGVWLIRKGGESDPNATAEVHVEVNGLWRHVITEPLSANFSHAASADGIRKSSLSGFEPTLQQPKEKSNARQNSNHPRC